MAGNRGTKCPKCKSNMKYSKLTQNGFICGNCNQVYIMDGNRMHKIKGGV